jgi:hypothetical protein
MQEQKPVKKKEEKYEWHDEGVATLVRVIILAWSGAILTLNYVSIPGVPQKQIDPTFIASVFTGTLATFGVQTAKKKEEEKNGSTKNSDTNGKVD